MSLRKPVKITALGLLTARNPTIILASAFCASSIHYIPSGLNKFGQYEPLSKIVDRLSTAFVLLRLRGADSKKDIIIEAKCSTRIISIISAGDRGDCEI